MNPAEAAQRVPYTRKRSKSAGQTKWKPKNKMPTDPATEATPPHQAQASRGAAPAADAAGSSADQSAGTAAADGAAAAAPSGAAGSTDPTATAASGATAAASADYSAAAATNANADPPGQWNYDQGPIPSKGTASDFAVTGVIQCPRCQMVVRGGRWALRQHQFTSSRCHHAAGLTPAAREPCRNCGRMLAAGDAWARKQHYKFCPGPGSAPSHRQRASSRGPGPQTGQAAQGPTPAQPWTFKAWTDWQNQNAAAEASSGTAEPAPGQPAQPQPQVPPQESQQSSYQHDWR